MMSSLIIQPAAADTFLYESSPANNYGNLDYIAVKTVGTSGFSRMRGLLRFNFSLIAANAIISAADLALYFFDKDGGAGPRPCGQNADGGGVGSASLGSRSGNMGEIFHRE